MHLMFNSTDDQLLFSSWCHSAAASNIHPRTEKKTKEELCHSNWDQENIFLSCCEFYYSRIKILAIFYSLSLSWKDTRYRWFWDYGWILVELSYLACAKRDFIFHYLLDAYNLCNRWEIKVSTLHSRKAFHDVHAGTSSYVKIFHYSHLKWAMNYIVTIINIQFAQPHLKSLTYIIFVAYYHQPSDSYIVFRHNKD